MNEFQKRVMLIVGLLAAVVTVDAVFANPKALQSAHGTGQQLTSLQASNHR